MRGLLLNSRRLIVVATAFVMFAALSGAATLAFCALVLGVEGEELVLLVTVGTGFGGVIGGAFGQPLFSAGLERVLIMNEPPMPSREKLDRWCAVLRADILRRRVQGPRSQREQMLRGGALMELTVSADLGIRPGRGGRPHVRASGESESFSELVTQWDSAQGRLVILGDPGYGKTFAALALIGHINQSEDQVAELFPLVDWHGWSAGREDPAIEDWLVEQLVQSYPKLDKTTAWAMIVQGRLTPVFDGLDELPENARGDCRDALEAYAGRVEPFQPFVVTCRHAEYLSLAPKWVGADRHVALLGLSGEQIASTIRAGTGSSEKWKNVVDDVTGGDERMVALLRSPLRLAAALEVYESRDPDELRTIASQPNAGEELWDNLLSVGGPQFEQASRSDVRRWLSFIAASLQSHDRQRFWLHELYLYASPQDRRRFALLNAAALASIAAVPWLLQRTFAGVLLVVLLCVALFALYRTERDSPKSYSVRERASAATFLKAGPGALGGGALAGIAGAAVLSPVLLAVFLASRLLAGKTIHVGASALAALEIAAFGGIFFGVLMAVVLLGEAGSSNVAEEPPARLLGRGPGAVVRATLVYSLVPTAVAAILFSALAFVGLFGHSWYLPIVGTALVAWTSGLDAWALYHWSRWRLARAGLIPRRLRRFLDWASEDTGWLRSSDSYEFRHRELLDYLARETSPVGASNLSWAEAPDWQFDKAGRARAEARRGYRLMRAGDPGGGRDAYLHVAKLEPKNARVRRALAEAFEATGEHRKQLGAALAAVDLDPLDAANHTSAGVAYDRLGDPIAALPHARRAVELDPTVVQWHLNEAVILSLQGRDREALGRLDEAIALGLPDDDKLKTYRADVQQRWTARQEMSERARRGVGERPEEPAAHWFLSKNHLWALDAAGAEAARQRAVALAREAPGENLSLAWELSVRGYAGDAAWIVEALPEDKMSSVARSHLAQALGGAGRVAEAERHLEEAAASAETPEELNALANALMRRGESAGAERAAAEAQHEAPENLTFAFTLAEARLCAGRLDDAREAFARALGLAGDAKALHGDPAWLCHLLWHRYGEATRLPAIEMVAEEYERHDFADALATGVMEATPVFPGQEGYDPGRLQSWCADWCRQKSAKRASGVVQALAAEAGDGPPFRAQPQDFLPKRGAWLRKRSTA